MQTTLKNIKKSAFELKSIYALTICGVLLALRVALGFLSIGGDTYRITFSQLPVFISSYLFGPIPGAIVGALGDIVTLIIKPTGPLNIGITLAQALTGFIGGLFLYNRPVKFWRTILACVTAAVICNLIITTISVVLMYHAPLLATLITRLITNAITVPINIILLFSIQQLIQRIRLPHVNVVR